jgi:hypothetical protein
VTLRLLRRGEQIVLEQPVDGAAAA